jgi:hypothetical protein
MAERSRINVVRHSFTHRLQKLSVPRQFARLCLLTTLCFPVWSYAQSAPQPPKLEPMPQIEKLPTAPPAPTLEQLPPHLPTVTFRNGELSIVADNAALRDILEMVRSQTGATIDIPPEANERVFVRLGPGPARQVLVSLLKGSDFNFIMLDSDSDPRALAKVVLSPKSSTAAEQASEPDAYQAAAPNGLGSTVVRRRSGA